MLNKKEYNSRFLEDSYRISNSLKTYDRFKKSIEPEYRDINRINAIEDLNDILNRNNKIQKILSFEKVKSDGISGIPKSEYTVHLDSDKLSIITPLSVRASCAFGADTSWCTATTEDNNRFVSYNERGPLYIITLKETGEKYQLHIDDYDNSIQFMDSDDAEANIYRLALSNKELADFIFKYFNNSIIFKMDIRFAKYIVDNDVYINPKHRLTYGTSNSVECDKMFSDYMNKAIDVGGSGEFWEVYIKYLEKNEPCMMHSVSDIESMLNRFDPLEFSHALSYKFITNDVKYENGEPFFSKKSEVLNDNVIAISKNLVNLLYKNYIYGFNSPSFVNALLRVLGSYLEDMLARIFPKIYRTNSHILNNRVLPYMVDKIIGYQWNLDSLYEDIKNEKITLGKLKHNYIHDQVNSSISTRTVLYLTLLGNALENKINQDGDLQKVIKQYYTE